MRERGNQPLDDVLNEAVRTLEAPVVAAGGIGTAARVREVIDRGAAGVRVGTRFLVAPESNAHPLYVQALLRARASDTVIGSSVAILTDPAPGRGYWRPMRRTQGQRPLWTRGCQTSLLKNGMDASVEPKATESFFGRSTEMNEIAGLLGRARSGHGTTLLVSGEAGIGKTRLAEETRRHATDRGLDVLWGRCSMEKGAPSFWPWIQIARDLALARGDQEIHSYPGAVELERILPGSGEGDPFATSPSEQARFRLLDQITNFFFAAARRRPLLIILDDLHWADEGTLDLARFMAEQIHSSPALLILTVREGDSRDPDLVAQFVAAVPTDAHRLRLEGLDESATTAIVVDVTGVTPSEDAATFIHRQAAGNPFFVREVSKLLVSQGRLHDLASGRRLPVPAAVRDVLEKRFARLSQTVSEMLSMASVLGTSFDQDLLELVAGTSRTRLEELIDEARSARVLVPDDRPGRYGFAHALMRETFYEGVADSAKRACHLKVAEALEDSDARPSEIFHHLVGALPDAPPDKIVDFAERAGREALSVFAYRDAAAASRQALDVLPSDATSTQRARLLLLLAEAEARLGERPAAAAHYRQVVQLGRRLGETELMGRAALGLAGGPGGFEVQTLDDDITDLLDDTLAALPSEETSLRAWLGARLSVALTYTDQQERRRALAREAVVLARDVADPAAHAYALSAYCDTIAGPQYVHDRLAAADEMIERAAAAHDLEQELLARRFRLVALVELGRFDAFDRELARFERLSDDLKQPVSAWYVPLWRAMRAHMLGHYRECERLLVDAERIGVAQAHSDNAYMLVFSLRWPLLYELGRIAEMEETVLDVDRRYGVTPATAVMVALNHLWMGRRGEAEAALQRMTEAGLSAFPKDAIWLATMALLILLAQGLNDARLMSELADELAPYADLHAFDGIAAVFFGSVHHWLGIIARMTGNDDEAQAQFETALKAHARAGAVVWLAHTRRELGALLMSRSDTKVQDRARELLVKAEEAYRELGVKEALIGRDFPRQVTEPVSVNTFRKKGDFWEVSYGGREALLKDTKGMQDLVRLLANPGVEFNVVDLIGAPRHASPADEVLDRRARDELARHAAELKDEIEDARDAGDPERAALLRQELEFIAKELSSAYGLGGRRRLSSDPAERARKTVTSRIRDALARIDAEHPPLGRHLRNALRTGLFCSYQPEDEVEWHVS